MGLCVACRNLLGLLWQAHYMYCFTNWCFAANYRLLYVFYSETCSLSLSKTVKSCLTNTILKFQACVLSGCVLFLLHLLVVLFQVVHASGRGIISEGCLI